MTVMTSMTSIWLVIFTAFVWLTASTLTGLALQRRFRGQHGPEAPLPDWLDNLLARNRSWWAMQLVFTAALALGKWTLTVLFIFVSFCALREFATLAPSRSADYRALLWSFLIFLPLQYALVIADWYGLYAILIPVYAFLLLPCPTAFCGDTTDFLDRVARIQWGLMLCVYCISHIPALLMLPLDESGDPTPNLGLVVYLVVVVEASDVFQYICGKLFGRRKLAPKVSPGKTAEGLIGGIALATLLGGLLSCLCPFNFAQGLGIALVLTVMGFCGGFVLSAVKRAHRVKDWGDLIEGHGGMLDRMDSLTFAAPVFFHIVRYFWT